VIGQACEFDYSGTQACRVLTEEGYRVILANSNPATIMTRPATAEPHLRRAAHARRARRIIERERPDALLPTLGGQTALNLTMALFEDGTLARYGVEVIGAGPRPSARPRTVTGSSRHARDRPRVPESGFAHSLAGAMVIASDIGFPIMVRPSFILGGAGTGIAHDTDTFARLAAEGLAASPVTEILVEKSNRRVEGVRARGHADAAADNCVIVCSIENFDAMGVHTGDSITVAPAQTLTDVEYQAMRDDAFACLRRVGVETGGSNVQFAVDPATGDASSSR